MSSHILNRVFQNYPGKNPELAILLAIAESANEQGNCITQIKLIAQAARVHEMTAHRAIKTLRAERWIVTDTKRGKKGSTIFQLNLPMIYRAQREGGPPLIRTAPTVPVEALLRRIGLTEMTPPEELGENDAA